MKAGSGHVAIVFLAGTALVFLAPRPGPAAKPRPPSDSERIKALPDEERQWLTEFVAPIILDEEKKAFLDLEAPYQREVFKREILGAPGAAGSSVSARTGLPVPL